MKDPAKTSNERVHSDPHAEAISRLTPSQKLHLAQSLYYEAKELKRSALISFHPDWPLTRVEEEVNRVFAHAVT